MDDYMEVGMNLKNCDLRPVDRTKDRLYPPTYWANGPVGIVVRVEFPTESAIYYGIS